MEQMRFMGPSSKPAPRDERRDSANARIRALRETPSAGSDAKENQVRSSLAYRALIFFALIYFFRPEDFIPGLDFIPIGKIAGGIALLALLVAVPSTRRQKLPIELKVLVALLFQMMLCIPFAHWRGGAYDTVVNKFSKGVIVAILIYMVALTVGQVRRLLAIQAGAIALVTIVSVFVHRTVDGRLMGIQQGILANSNDLAINIAINFPLCLAFLLTAKNGITKLFWGGGLLFMLWGVVATYSRSGLIATVVTIAICVWEFGVRGRRPLLLGAAFMIALAAAGVSVATPHYLIRIESMVRGNIEGSGDRGSLEAREELLRDSLRIMATHPVFGIGPGNFSSYTQTWRVAHNTYTELGAETGVPGVLLFCTLLVLSLRKIKRIRKSPGYQASADIRVWTSALWAAMAAYISGALFASTEYNLFPYFIVGYICAVYQIANSQSVSVSEALTGGIKKLGDHTKRQRELAWTR